MKSVQVFEALLSALALARRKLPMYERRYLPKISLHELEAAMTEIEAIPDMLGALHDAEFQLRAWRNSLSWEDEDKYTDKKKKELESLISRIQSVLRELK